MPCGQCQWYQISFQLPLVNCQTWTRPPVQHHGPHSAPSRNPQQNYSAQSSLHSAVHSIKSGSKGSHVSSDSIPFSPQNEEVSRAAVHRSFTRCGCYALYKPSVVMLAQGILNLRKNDFKTSAFIQSLDLETQTITKDSSYLSVSIQRNSVCHTILRRKKVVRSTGLTGRPVPVTPTVRCDMEKWTKHGPNKCVRKDVRTVEWKGCGQKAFKQDMCNGQTFWYVVQSRYRFSRALIALHSAKLHTSDDYFDFFGGDFGTYVFFKKQDEAHEPECRHVC